MMNYSAMPISPSVQVEITGLTDSPVAGEMYSLTCTVTLSSGLIGLIPTIEWRDPRGVMVIGDGRITVGGVTGSGTSFTSILSFVPLQSSDGGVYICEATSGSVMETGSFVQCNTSSMLPKR